MDGEELLNSRYRKKVESTDVLDVVDCGKGRFTK